VTLYSSQPASSQLVELVISLVWFHFIVFMCSLSVCVCVLHTVRIKLIIIIIIIIISYVHVFENDG